MFENWKTYKLGAISEIIMGQSPKGATTNNLGEGLPLLNGPTEFGYSYPTPTQFTIDPKKISKKMRSSILCERFNYVPFSELDNLLKEVIEQAEGQYGDWLLEV